MIIKKPEKKKKKEIILIFVQVANVLYFMLYSEIQKSDYCALIEITLWGG